MTLNVISFVAALAISSAAHAQAIPPLVAAPPGEGFLANYEPSGRPKQNLTSYFQERFGWRLNHVVPAQDEVERVKWSAILRELRRYADRTLETPRELVFTENKELAREHSLAFEKRGTVQNGGAWSIAVQGTASRHGFAAHACSETLSEVIRQAYKRAGYDHRADFNKQRGNALFWTHTASVTNLSNALIKAGWIPWDASQFKPLAGAPSMKGKAISPGHSLIIGGDDGRFIVDEVRPEGVDLRTLSDVQIKQSYLIGVFFLPPGIIPERWEP